MTHEVIEDRFFVEERWQPGKECLNMQDINMPPSGYSNNKENWLKDLTTYIYLYPKEWKQISEEYIAIQENEASISQLLYFRDDEGYLRKKDEDDIYLRIRICGDKEAVVLNAIAECVLDRWKFKEYEEYCQLGNAERRGYIQQMQKEISKMMGIQENKVMVSYEVDYESSDFNGEDLYIDQLNQLYIIL